MATNDECSVVDLEQDSDASTDSSRSLKRQKRILRPKNRVQYGDVAADSKPNRLPSDRNEIGSMLKALKQAITRQAMSSEVSARVIHAALTLQHRDLVKRQKSGNERAKRMPPAQVNSEVCDILGIGRTTYLKIMGEYLQSGKYYEPEKGRGNWTKKATRIPRTKQVTNMIRNFVRLRRAQRQRVTARQILQYLVDEKLLGIPRDSDGNFQKQPFESAYRNVRRLVAELGFRPDKRSGNLELNHQVVQQRDEYLKQYFELRALPREQRYREVYLGESYIYHRYHQLDDSVRDPDDEQELGSESDGKCWFIAAINGPDPTLLGQEDTTQQTKGGLVPGSYWRTSQSTTNTQSSDCQNIFNRNQFVKWWKEQLLPNLQQKSLIIMDSTSYHMTYPPSTPQPAEMNKSAKST